MRASTVHQYQPDAETGQQVRVGNEVRKCRRRRLHRRKPPQNVLPRMPGYTAPRARKQGTRLTVGIGYDRHRRGAVAPLPTLPPVPLTTPRQPAQAGWFPGNMAGILSGAARKWSRLTFTGRETARVRATLRPCGVSIRLLLPLCPHRDVLREWGGRRSRMPSTGWPAGRCGGR